MITKHRGSNASPRSRHRNPLSRTTPRRAALVALTAIVSVVMAVPATATAVTPSAASQDSGAQIFRNVMESPDPAETLAGLTAEQQASFAAAVANSTPVTTREASGPLSNSQAQAVGLQPLNLPGDPAGGSSGCWYHYSYQEWSDFDIHDGDTWMQLNWCTDGQTITSSSITNVGGKSTVSGEDYNGATSKGKLNVGYEERAYTEFDFSILWDHVYPCMQIRGDIDGYYTTVPNSCNLS